MRLRRPLNCWLAPAIVATSIMVVGFVVGDTPPNPPAIQESSPAKAPTATVSTDKATIAVSPGTQWRIELLKKEGGNRIAFVMNDAMVETTELRVTEHGDGVFCAHIGDDGRIHGKVHVELKGPFTFDRSVAISEPVYFVDHPEVCIHSYGRFALVGVKFFFGGDPQPDTLVRVAVKGLSDTGEELFSDEEVCQDRRAAKPESLRVGIYNIFVFAVPKFKVPRESVEKMAELRITFDLK